MAGWFFPGNPQLTEIGRYLMNVIDCSGLGKVYRGKKGKKVVALADLDLQVGQGEIFGFLGPNGAGKSTTIKTLMGLITPSSGEAFLCGLPVSESEGRRNVGFLPENPAFYDFLSAQEYLAYVGHSFRMSAAAIRQETERVLCLLELEHASKRPIRSYSKGMVQRLGLAQTMLHDPDLYILDEPMSGLDPIGRSLVKKIILDLKSRGKTVFFSTHITSDVEIVCNRVGVIVGGRLQVVKDVQDVLHEGVVGYLIKTGEITPQLAAQLDCEIREGELYVVKDRLTSVLAALHSHGVPVDLVEPRRKDLEAFFLDMVARSRS